MQRRWTCREVQNESALTSSKPLSMKLNSGVLVASLLQSTTNQMICVAGSQREARLETDAIMLVKRDNNMGASDSEKRELMARASRVDHKH